MTLTTQHKRKLTSSYAWIGGDLTDGEIGVNFADGTLHLKNSAGSVGTFIDETSIVNVLSAYTKNYTLNQQTGTTYTLVLSDNNVIIEMDNTSANTITIPPNSSVAFDIGTTIVGYQSNTGQTTILIGAGVTLNTNQTSTLSGQFSVITLIKVGVDEWTIVGDVEALTPNEELFKSKYVGIDTRVTNHTLVSSDDSRYIRMDNAAANTITIPPNSSVAFTLGTQIDIRQVGTGQTSVVEGSGVTINTPETLKLNKQHSTCSIIKIGSDEWDLVGDLETL
jgi:hypothetical protein